MTLHLLHAAPTTNVDSALPSKAAAARITVFSAAQYVEAFLKQPLKDAGFKNLNFTEVWQIEAADWRDY
jgi:hypothetical protein